jgi:hypothetical protein
LFAVNLRNEEARATFHLDGRFGAGAGATEVEVIGEDRKIAVREGSFGDAFGAYAVHLSRVGKGR